MDVVLLKLLIMREAYCILISGAIYLVVVYSIFFQNERFFNLKTNDIFKKD